MNELKGKSVLITGGAGFVGSFIVDQLLDEGIGEIVVIDNLVRGSRANIEKGLSSGKVKMIEGDIRDRKLVGDLLQGKDYCFHMAALRITQCAGEPEEALTTMYDGTFHVIQECIRHKIKKMVFASSASIYGQADTFPTKEVHHPYNNQTLYGAAKTANELMLRSFHHMAGLSYNALRYFNIYGPRMDVYGKYTEVLIRWYHLIKEGKPPLIFGDGKQTMDFIYVEEIARATILALKAQVENEVFNIAGGKETSLEELCRALLEAMGSDLKPQYVPVPDARKKVEVYRRLADVSKAKEMIGFEAKVDMKEGLKKLVQWLDQQKKVPA